MKEVEQLHLIYSRFPRAANQEAVRTIQPQHPTMLLRGGVATSCRPVACCLTRSGTMLVAGLDHGAAKVIGIDQEKKHLGIARRRIQRG